MRHKSGSAWTYLLRAAFGTLLLNASLSAHGGPAPSSAGNAAQPTLNAIGGGGTPTAVVNYFEQNILSRTGETVEALGPTLMGDSLNEFSGGLSFTHTDVSLPGNNALVVAVGRHLAVGAKQAHLANGLFGDWDLDIPRLRTVASSNYLGAGNWFGNGLTTAPNLNRCSQFQPPPPGSALTSQRYVTAPAHQWWDGYHMIIPGTGDQTMLLRDASNTTQPTDGYTYPVVTKQHWQIRCLPSLENGTGEAFMALSPDGTRYQFDHMVSRAYPTFRVTTTAFLPRTELLIFPTQITDRFGNWVRYNYGGDGGWRVMSITSSDGRVITFGYSDNGNRIQTVSDGTRVWTYSYDSGGALQTVTQPDGSRWQFALSDIERDPFSSPDPDCDYGDALPPATWDNATRVGTIIHPSGATGTFGLRMTMHGRSNVPGNDAACGGSVKINGTIYANGVSRYFTNYSLTSKTLAGPGMPAMTWTYAYSAAAGSFAPCNGCVNTKTVTITDPGNNWVQNTYGTQFGVNDGLLLASSEGAAGSSTMRSAKYDYRASNVGPYPAKIGRYAGVSEVMTPDSMSAIHTPQSQRIINQQGVNFTQSVSSFDSYARATSVIKNNSLGYSKSDTTAYHDDTNLWVLSQIASTSTNGVESSSTTFYDGSVLPKTAKSFGKLQTTYAFNTDGTLARITDGLSHPTSFSNYMRGLPQRIDYADGSSITGVVHNIGVLASTTSEAGPATTWNYTYDPMGRLASKIPPSGDAVTYNPTTYSFVPVGTSEYGLEPGHWRQTITTGAAVTANYFDARWRKRLTITYDANNPSATQRLQRFDYDPYNRTTFAAYPARAIGSISDAVPGTTTTYDALGRPTVTKADSELGTLTSTTDYLDGFQKRVTNPRGFATTTSFQVFDEPSESAITSITAPEGVSVAISRDTFGKPLSITRGGNGASATRAYVYDTNQLLCKTIEPEIGATIQSLDAANNISWRAIGLGLTSTATCDQGSVPDNKKIAYTYDPRNRLTGTGFADGSPSIGRSYTPDGLPATVTAGGSTWTYGYNNRRLLTGETLQFPNAGGWGVPRSYDANGHQSGMTYPDGTNIVFNPNALGEPTQVGSYATGVSYHPNGAVAGYTLGNGVAHATTQNVRGLPYRNIDADVMQDRYDYDANGNIASITDEYQGISSRALGYDGLDRLTAANSPGVWGNASYGYDTLDNLRTSTVGGRSAVHGYNARNQLETLTANGVATGFVYDSQGNVTGRGSQGFYFDQGNRMQLANGKASYQYDGLGRRVVTSSLDGTTTYQMYSQDGQMLARQTVGGSSNNSLTLQIYLGGKTIAETNSASGTAYLYTDALGSPVATSRTVPATVAYGCPAGWSLAGSTCSQGTTTTQPASVTGYTCPSGYTLSGANCSLTTNTASPATVNYACPAGWALSGTSCSYTSSSAATPVYACPAGFTLSGSTCSSTSSTAATSTLSCNGRGSLQAYALSPSGYKCTVQTFLVSDDPAGQCGSVADSAGLRLVATLIINKGKQMQCVMGPVTSYSCPSGGTLSGSSCISSVTQAASVSYACASGTLSGSSCLSTSTSAASSSYSCPAGQALSGATCYGSSTSLVSGTPIYSCPAGYTLAGSSCSIQSTVTTATTAIYSCASGTVSGASCLNALTRTRYEPYGNTAAGTVPNGIGFTGHVNDPDTGLVYMQARYYDPIAARFLSTDPVTTDANTGSGFNVYEYAKSNPYRYTDPDGRAPGPLIEVEEGGRSAEPIGARGMDGAAVPYSIGGSRASLAEARAQLKANVEQGKAGEAVTREKLGDKVAGEQVTFKTNDGTRARTDFVTKDKAVIETKTGDAKLSPGQTKLKADIDAGRTVTPVGQNAVKAGLPSGQPTTMTCCKIDRIRGGQ